MKYKKVLIAKEDRKSQILGETIPVLLEPRMASAYLQLLQQTWPSTVIKSHTYT